MRELQRGLSSEDVQESAAEAKYRKAAGAGEILNEFIKYRGERRLGLGNGGTTRELGAEKG